MYTNVCLYINVYLYAIYIHTQESDRKYFNYFSKLQNRKN